MDCFGLFQSSSVPEPVVKSESCVNRTSEVTPSVIVYPQIALVEALEVPAVESLLTVLFTGIDDGKMATAKDKEDAAGKNVSLLFGEISVKGFAKALDPLHLHAGYEATTLFDLGSGLGKLAIQAYCQFLNLKNIVAVEFATSRYLRAIAALERFPQMERNKIIKEKRATFPPLPARTIEFRNDDLFVTSGVESADIVILQTNFYESQFPAIVALLQKFKVGCRVLSCMVWSCRL